MDIPSRSDTGLIDDLMRVRLNHTFAATSKFASSTSDGTAAPLDNARQRLQLLLRTNDFAARTRLRDGAAVP